MNAPAIWSVQLSLHKHYFDVCTRMCTLVCVKIISAMRALRVLGMGTLSHLRRRLRSVGTIVLSL